MIYTLGLVMSFFNFSFVHKFRLREKPIDESNTSQAKGYECLCIGNQNLGTVRR
jgi:hypothetical protein